MTTKIIHKKSSVVARVPSAGDLEYGEIAINYADGRLYYKNSSNQIKSFLDSDHIASLFDAERITDTVFNVVNGGSSQYAFTGDGFSSSANNPTLYLTRGKTYKFNVNASGHPFQIRVSSGGSAYSDGVVNNGAQVGSVFFTPDMDAPNSLVYQCTNHAGMVGDIVIVDNALFAAASHNQAWSTITSTPTTISGYGITDAFDGAYGSLSGVPSTFTPASHNQAWSTITSTPTTRSGYGITDAQATLVSGTNIKTVNGTSLLGSGNITISGGSGGTDSAAVINLIDSDYIQARQSVSGTVDSAQTISLARGAVSVTTGSASGGGALAYNSSTGVLTFNPSTNSGGGGGATIANDVTLNSFAGDSSTTAFTLSTSPLTDQNIFVTINGVSQHVNAYSLNGSVLTFDSAPEVGDAIEARTITAATVSLRDHQDYIYQLSTPGYVLSGTDINGNTLSYDVDKMEVFLNGSRLTPALDYTATNGTSVTLLTDYPIDSSDTVTVSSFGKAYLIDRGVVPAEQDTPTAATQYIADTYSASLYRTSKYIIQLEHDSDNKYHSTEVLLTHDGTSVYMTEYGDVKTDSSLGTIDADISGGNVRLLVTPEYNNTSIKTQRITVGA
jgi:hypothetical protein